MMTSRESEDAASAAEASRGSKFSTTSSSSSSLATTKQPEVVWQSPANYVAASPYSETGIYTPPLGRWKDDLCNCFSNLWPSCCCVTMGSYFGGLMPVWLAGQISARIGWVESKFIILGYILLFLAFWAVAIVITASAPPGDRGGAVILYYFPCLAAFIFFIVLRIKFVEKFRIPESCLMACCTAFWCGPCSLCQMARHLYGYTEIFDGDGLLSGGMRYDSLAGHHAPPVVVDFDGYDRYIQQSRPSAVIAVGGSSSSNNNSNDTNNKSNVGGGGGAPNSTNNPVAVTGVHSV